MAQGDVENLMLTQNRLGGQPAFAVKPTLSQQPCVETLDMLRSELG